MFLRRQHKIGVVPFAAPPRGRADRGYEALTLLIAIVYLSSKRLAASAGPLPSARNRLWLRVEGGERPL